MPGCSLTPLIKVVQDRVREWNIWYGIVWYWAFFLFFIICYSFRGE